ncbi:MAG: cyclic-di-AMP receptor, partial [Oscillospiraceae bacterium]|nr:cyclic-di-AMP receptor [Oscillospiraceae bacterium]MDY5581251.1 cyclic-di-AMP receptor [Oscillospiraceae bacterium]
MKLLIAIVNNDDSAVVSSALTKEGYTVTKLSTTGGFLMVGNTTFLIGADDDKV